MTLFIHRNLLQEITVMIINTGQMCTVNYSGRPRMCDLKCPDCKKNKRVVDLIHYKKKMVNIRRIKTEERIFFLFLTVINNVSPFP